MSHIPSDLVEECFGAQHKLEQLASTNHEITRLLKAYETIGETLEHPECLFSSVDLKRERVWLRNRICQIVEAA